MGYGDNGQPNHNATYKALGVLECITLRDAIAATTQRLSGHGGDPPLVKNGHGWRSP